WFALQEGADESIPLGESFSLELNTRDLRDPGSYEIIFRTADPLDSTCTVEKILDLQVNPLPEWTYSQRSDASNCDAEDGSVTIRALTDIDSLFIEGIDEVFTLLANETVRLTDLAVGYYNVRAVNGGCESGRSIVISNRNPPRELEYVIHGVSEKCNDPNTGLFRLVFPNGPTSGTYYIRSEVDDLVVTGDFSNQSVLEIPVPPGVYKVEIVGEDGCRYPNTTTFFMDPVPGAEFSIPDQVSSCGPFTFRPVSQLAVRYTLIDATGNESGPAADGSFTLVEAGTYTVRAEGLNPEDNLCPVEKTIQVDLGEVVAFELIRPDLSCEGPFTYEIDLLGRNPNEVDIRWFDDLGQRVASSITFTPSIAGEYAVEVGLSGTINCPGSREAFTVPEPATPIEIFLEFTPFCGEDAFTTLSIDADLAQVAEIVWLEESNGIFEVIPNTEGEESISVTSAGSYSVVVYNTSGCEIGRDEVAISRSTIVPTGLEARYVICQAKHSTRSVEPGVYDSCAWILDNETLSTEARFSTIIAGRYQLRVADEAGCEFVVEFVVEEDCEMKITFPNAITPDAKDKGFVIYANDFVDEVETLIYNRWGELIFHCTHQNVEPGTSFCPWDGRINGKLVHIGTYPIIIRCKSENQGLEKIIKTALVVVE